MAHRVTGTQDVAASIGAVLDVALTVDDVLAWFPLPLHAVDVPEHGRMEAGQSCEAEAMVAGRRFRTRITILEADANRFRLSSTGSLCLAVDARLEPIPEGCRIEAVVETRSGGGLEGRVLEAASRPLLGTGLRRALGRIAELAPARDADARTTA